MNGDMEQHPLRITREAPEPVDAPYALERMAVLVHELTNLLDGSIRCLGQARHLVGQTAATHGASLEGAVHQMDVVYSALRRMADLVRGALTASVPLGSPSLPAGQAICLGDAIDHAVEVLSPLAVEAGIAVRAELPRDLAASPAGPLYGVVLNALRNAIESVHRAGGSGHVEIVASARGTGDDRWIHLAIRDDGLGPPRGLDRNRVFEPGFSTRPGGQGLGLAIAEAIIRDLGGTIELTERIESRPAAPPPARPGAILSIAYPMPEGHTRAA